MAASIGNAVPHALGTRIRELPLTRERIMATMLAHTERRKFRRVMPGLVHHDLL